ncbi:MAG: hypothetical protein EA378_03325 [Phycisphaerales bacterium]|nr:MAG: hypothetical protein EA378_03325 [Phycisphaerales bacterium]
MPCVFAPARSRARVRARLLSLAAVGACVGALWGCGASGVSPLGEGTTTVAPFTELRHGGLEVRWWVVDDGWGALGPALASASSRPVPWADGVREAWSRSGLRVVAVPVEALDALQASLPMAGPARSIWHGALPEWTEIAGGPRLSSGVTVRLSDGLFRVPQGRFRLLARSWASPASSPEGSAGLRVELTPQLAAPSMASDETSHLALWSRRLEDEPRGPGWSEGIAFGGLRSSFRSERAMAYLLVPESPEVDWSSLPAPTPPPSVLAQQEALRALRSAVGPEGDPDGGDARGGEDVWAGEDEAPVLGVFGPELVGPPTLGEAMLRSLGPGGRAGAGRLKVVVVLVPHPPESFDLLGRGR